MKGWKKLLLGATATLSACSLSTNRELSNRDLFPQPYFSQIDTTKASLEKRAREIKADGRPFFSTEQVRILHRTNTLENALDFAKKSSHSALDIVRYSKLGVTRKEVDEFEDTEKPNAALIFPSEDENISDTSAFYNRHNRILINRLRERYDLLVKIATLEDDICEVTNTAKNAEFLMLAGHGSKQNLLLGNPNKSKRINTPAEKFMLGMDDLEDLRRCFNQLSPNAVILLSSCSTAEEDPSNNNLANSVRKASFYRKVIAAKKAFTASGIKVDSIYPFSARMITEYIGGHTEDVTYIGKTFDEIYAGLRLPKNSVLDTKTLKVSGFFK